MESRLSGGGEKPEEQSLHGCPMSSIEVAKQREESE